MHTKWLSIVPDSFTVPTYYEQAGFVFTPLSVADIEEDYKAVISNAEFLRGTFDFLPNWPDKNITKEEDLSNLGWHQTEFAMRTSFAYKIEKFSTKEYVGCLYIFPSNSNEYEIDVFYWLIQKEESSLIEVENIIKNWVTNYWPFKAICFKQNNNLIKPN